MLILLNLFDIDVNVLVRCCQAGPVFELEPMQTLSYFPAA